MNNIDRGMIKWQPFNSVINNKYMVNSIMNEKAKIKIPIISEEEKKQIEEDIINAYYMKNNIQLIYFKDGSLKEIKGKIKKIDQIYKIIYLENVKVLFNQIISVKN